MTIEVRRATPDDLSGVLGVFLGCWRESYAWVLSADLIASMTDERAEGLWRRVLADPVGVVLVAERDGEIVGVTRYAIGDDGDGAVHSLYVSPRAHGSGIGRLLLSAAIEEIAKAGAKNALLWVFAANAPSIGFYEAQGWLADGTTRTQPEFGALEQRMWRGLA